MRFLAPAMYVRLDDITAFNTKAEVFYRGRGHRRDPNAFVAGIDRENDRGEANSTLERRVCGFWRYLAFESS